MKEKAKILMRLSGGGCIAATLLATLGAMQGDWLTWGINAVLFLILAGLCLFIITVFGMEGF